MWPKSLIEDTSFKTSIDTPMRRAGGTPARWAFENRCRSREQPATGDWIAQVRDRLCAVADSIQLGSFGGAKARELRKDVPDPVPSLAARPEFGEGRRKPGVRLILRPREALKV